MRFLTSIGCSRTSNSATRAVPEVGGRKQVSTRMVVVLPAPLGPRKPTICPLSTEKEMLSTATWFAYPLVNPSTVIIMIKLDEGARCLFSGNTGECKRMASMRLPADNHDSGDGEEVSI